MELWKQELYHHGILGMKWGVRRYQNPDGSLTSAGKRRYGTGSPDNSDIVGARGAPHHRTKGETAIRLAQKSTKVANNLGRALFKPDRNRSRGHIVASGVIKTIGLRKVTHVGTSALSKIGCNKAAFVLRRIGNVGTAAVIVTHAKAANAAAQKARDSY